MGTTSWTDAEDEALDYLPHLDQVIYLRGIRRRMDYRTGLAGVTTPISYAWLAQLAEVHTERGSTVRPPRRPTREQLRAVFRRLERRGLIRWIRDHGGRGLVFECLVARRGGLSAGGTTLEQPLNNPCSNPKSNTSSDPENSSSINSLNDGNNPRSNPRNDLTRSVTRRKSNPIPVSGIYNPPSGDYLYTSPPPRGGRKGAPQPAPRPASPFDAFWAAYPKKVGKKPCREKWRAKQLDRIAERIIADVERRKREHRPWLQGFVPNPLTYLNQERWEDEIEPAGRLPEPEPHHNDAPRDDLLSPRSRAAVNEAVRQFRAGRRAAGGKG